AEDGIRDFHVTGVQTCALPISSVKADSLCSTRRFTHSQRNSQDAFLSSVPGSRRASCRIWKPLQIPSTSPPRFAKLVTASITGRSEERRVGKECRSHVGITASN